MLSFKPTFPLSSFTFIKRLFSSYLLSAIQVVSSAYQKGLIFLSPSVFPSIRVFSNKSALHIRWPKYWSSSEHSGLISFRMGLGGSPCSPRDSQESSPTPQFKSINSSVLSFLHSSTFTSIHDLWKNHSLD